MVIKSGKKHTSHEKLRSLNLLDKALLGAAKNPAFVTYVQKKIMDRLRIMCSYCPKDMQISDASNLPQRGSNLFLADELQPRFAAIFLVQLLHNVQSWAAKFPKEGNNPSTFTKVHTELVNQGVSFPGQALLQACQNAAAPKNAGSRNSELEARQ